MGSVLTLSEPSDGHIIDGVAFVSVSGPLASRSASDLCGYVDGYDAIAGRVIGALREKSASAVVLVIDSPGGDVPGLEESVRKIVEARDKAQKPIFAYVNELAASAAYWIASSVADGGIYGPAAARVGSIGVISALVDETEALKKAGLKVTVIREPEGKAENHPAGPVSELAEGRARDRVRAIAGRFFEAVAKARGLEAKNVAAMNAAVFEGGEAVKAGLLDGITSLDGLCAIAAEQGRTRRKQLEQAAMDEKEFEALKGFQASVVEATGAKASDEVLAKIESIKTAHEALAAKAARVDELEAQLKAYEAEKAQAEIASIIDEAVTSGRLRPAKRDEFIAKAQRYGAEWARDTVQLMEPAADVAPKAPPIGSSVPSDLEANARSVGMSPEEYARLASELRAQFPQS